MTPNKFGNYSTFILAMIFMGCNPVQFEQLTVHAYTPSIPCKVNIVVTMPEEASEFLLIGICKTKGSVSSKRNKAMEDLEQCACEHGGDLLLISDYYEIHGSPQWFDSRQIVESQLVFGNIEVAAMIYATNNENATKDL